MFNLLRRSGAILTFAALGCAAGSPGAAQAETCDQVLQILHSTAADLSAGHHVYRQLPTLLPGRNRTLDIDLLMKRSNVFIGPYWVEGVPTMSVTPRPGTDAYILDVTTGRNVRVPTECMSRPELAFGGTRWKLEQGDRIDAIFRSALDFNKTTASAPNTGGSPCNSSNLHGHGLLVSPKRGNADEGVSYGDYIYDVTQPESSRGSPVDTCDPGSAVASNPPSVRPRTPRELERAMPVAPASKHKEHLTTINPLHYQIDIPRGRVRGGDPVHDPLATGYHPSGIMWYHTHPHGYTRAQLNGGASGFISVGGVCDNLTVDNQACREDVWNLHYIALKDTQVDPKGVDQQGRHRFSFAKGYDMTLCADDAANAKATGKTLKGECNGTAAKPGKWLFTLNGMLYPTIKTVPGKIDVWMLANMSPNVSYNLQLIRAADGAPQPVKVLAVDGVSSGQYMTDTLFMMPGSRAEIMLNLNQGEYIFRQTGFFTGQDEWPAIDLARVVIDEPAATRRRFDHPWRRTFEHVRGLNPVYEPGEMPPVHAPVDAKEACAKVGVRHVDFVWQAKDPNNINSKEIFGLLSGVQGSRDAAPVYFDADGRATNKSARSIYMEYDKKDASGRLVHPNGVAFSSQPFHGICTMKGREETWIVKNWTPEIHNLHLHQARFRIVSAQQSIASAPRVSSAQYTTQRQGRGAGHGMGHDVARQVEGVNRSLDFMHRLLSHSDQAAGFADTYHDSIPIMMATPIGNGQCDGSPDNPGCQPATIVIKARLDRDEQIGAMVYHCHIIEHEDNGMMGMFRVCDPSRRRNDPDADPECFAANN
jgi:FtsP/CotA-like multicopper oxidase with cupredoxin domain